MSAVIVTDNKGSLGREVEHLFREQGLEVIGLGDGARWQADLFRLFERHGNSLQGVVHTKAPDPTDPLAAGVAYQETLALLEGTRKYAPEAAFLFASTQDVYGETPNYLPLVEHPTRWDIAPGHAYTKHGFDESLSIDHTRHGLRGASLTASDLLVQEYGHSYGLATAVFRCGDLHAPGEGFLSELATCAREGRPYVVHGFEGKQVRDVLHVRDAAQAFWNFLEAPSRAKVYNLGGSRHADCSLLEAAQFLEEMGGGRVGFQFEEDPSPGALMWRVSDVRHFQRVYAQWQPRYTVKDLLSEIVAGLQPGSVAASPVSEPRS